MDVIANKKFEKREKKSLIMGEPLNIIQIYFNRLSEFTKSSQW